MTPSVGRIVHVTGPRAESNGATVAPAIITRVWSDGMVNVTAFPDSSAPITLTSVNLYADEEAAGPAGSTHRAFWPPRG